LLTKFRIYLALDFFKILFAERRDMEYIT